MIETAFSQLNFARSMLLGRPFSLRALDNIIASMLETQREFGAIGAEGAEVLSGPGLDEETRRDMQLRRFHKQAVIAAHETPYYEELFARIGLDPGNLTYEEIARIPFTTKVDIRDRPDDFVRRTARPVFRTTTTGMTGRPTSVSFSAYEMSLYIALGAISMLTSNHASAEDIVIISSSSRATLGNLCSAGSLARVGALVFNGGLVEPELTLALLSDRFSIQGKRDRVSIMITYPSYLGQIVECGLGMGYKPSDFGLRLISVGGEVVTQGVKTRAKQLFGDAVQFDSGSGMTEIWPFNGQQCEMGHLHFEATQGLLELYNPETGASAQPGEAGVLVATPFPPFRDTTIVLRYDTQDVVRVLEGPLGCRMKQIPAVSDMQGKLKLSVRHEHGWTFVRDVAEALEALDDVPLPARYGFWAVSGGVGVEVVTRSQADDVKRRVEASLEGRGVPVRELHLLADRGQLRNPLPLRGDLRELSFAMG